jgi:hypothetical protein
MPVNPVAERLRSGIKEAAACPQERAPERELDHGPRALALVRQVIEEYRARDDGGVELGRFAQALRTAADDASNFAKALHALQEGIDGPS